MASGTQRDIRLGINIEVNGKEGIKELGDDLGRLADEGMAAAPAQEKLAAELDQVTAATDRLRKAERELQGEVAKGKAARNELRDALQRTKLTASEADKATDAYKESIKAAQLAILNETAALRTKQTALKEATAAARAAAAEQKRLEEQLKASTAQQAVQVRTAKEGLSDVAAQLRTLQTAAGAVVGGQLLGGLVGDVAKTADAFNNLAARIKLVTGDGEGFRTIMQGVFDVAQRTGTSLDTVADLFTKLATAGKQIGLSNQQALALTETIGQAVQLSGVSAESASAAIVQLVQGLSSGTLRGEELNSVLEQAPRLARALADGLGVTTGELRKLGEAGALTSQQVIGALQGQGATLRAEFETLPPTVGRALTNLSSAWAAYIGQADKATGASATAARAIEALAKNLDTVATVLYDVGKATLAYQALKLAQTFTGIGTAARGATVEVAAFGAAQTAAGTAAAGTAANVSKIGAALSSLKTFALLGIVLNLKDIGTAIGETAAKWAGWGKVVQDAKDKADMFELTSRAIAESQAAIAQQMRIAADRALALNPVAQALIGTFEKATQAGDTTADALGKVAKAMDLSNTQGIEAAGAALDALAVRGKITGDQLRDAMAGALKGVDLGLFETQARAAFDNSEIGARRLAAAIDAVGNEALHRAGLSVQELRTGFGAAFAASINDADALAATLDRLGAKGPETGAALAKALDKAAAAAGTEKAIQAVIERFEALGKAGRLSADQVAAGIEEAREKLDSLKPGVNTLREALHDFGIRSSEEMHATADRFAESWKVIRDSVQTSLDDKIEAFEKYAAAATAANKGVETSEISLQREMLRTQQIAERRTTTNGAPLQPERGYRHDGPRREIGYRLGGRNPDGSYRDNADSLGIIGPNQDVRSTINQGLDLSKGTNTLPIDKAAEVLLKGAAAFTAADLDYLKEAKAQAVAARQQLDAMQKLSAGSVSPQAIRDANAMLAATTTALSRATQQQAAADRRATTKTVEIKINGKKTPINVVGEEDSNALVGMLRRLEEAAGTAQ